MTSTKGLYREIASALATAGVDPADLTARWILEDFAGIKAADLLTAPDAPIFDAAADTCRAALARHLAGEPLSRITGVREFYGLPFALNAATLDPREDTETLVREVLDWVRETGQDGKTLRALDLGTGTGCIAIALLKHLPNLTAVAVDVAPDAVAQARVNADKNGVADRFLPLCGNWADALAPDARFDLILSNPPYIPAGDIPNLSESVQKYDPILALDGGEDGLDAYRVLMDVVKIQLDREGAAFWEIGKGQLPALRRLAQKSGVALSRATLDSGGIPRVVRITKEED